jgi:hypothetical protein
MRATIRSRTVGLVVCCLKTVKIRIYRTVILPVVPYGCEAWSLTLREEHGLLMFENRVRRKIIGPIEGRRDERVEKST